MGKRATAPDQPAITVLVARALQAAWLGSLGRYVQAGELVDVSGAHPDDVAAWAAAGVLATEAVMSDLVDGPAAAIIMQDKE